MNVFFCDLTGTFDSREDEDRDELITKFVSILTDICKKLDINDLVFRFITTNHMSELLPFIEELKPYTDGTPIRLTSQFSSHHKYKNGKIERISANTKIDQMRYISEGRGVERIFYADDGTMNQMMAMHIMPKVCPNVEMISFIPNSEKIDATDIYHSTKSGLSGLIEALETYQNELNMNMEKGKSI